MGERPSELMFRAQGRDDDLEVESMLLKKGGPRRRCRVGPRGGRR